MMNTRYSTPLAVQSPFTVRKRRDGIVYFRFSNALCEAIRRDFSYFGYVAADENAHIARLAGIFADHIGSWGIECLSRLSTGVDGEGIVIFENLPYEAVDWSPLPGAPSHSAKQTSLSEHLILAISAFFGQAYGVASEGYRLVNDLIPSSKELNRFNGNGSKQTLGLHSENAALRFLSPGHDFSPKGLLLTGVSVQSSNGPVTPVANAARAVALLPDWAKSILRRPCTKLALPERHRIVGSDIVEVGPVPVILGPTGKEEVIAAFYGDIMRPVSDEAATALELLNENLNEVAVELRIVPGVMAYIANGRALHGRSSFEPIFDNDGRAQRWIQRVFVTGRLDAFFESNSIADRVFDLAPLVNQLAAEGK